MRRGAPARTALENAWVRLPGPAPTQPSPAQPSPRSAFPGAGSARRGAADSGIPAPPARGGLLGSVPSPGLREVLRPQGNSSRLQALERDTIYPARGWVWSGGSRPPPTFPAARPPRLGRGAGGSLSPGPEGGAGLAGAGGGRAVEGRGALAQSRPEPPFIQHQAEALLLHRFPPPSSCFNRWVRGKGRGKSPLSGLEKKESSHTSRESKKEERTEGGWRQTDTGSKALVRTLGGHIFPQPP